VAPTSRVEEVCCFGKQPDETLTRHTGPDKDEFEMDMSAILILAALVSLLANSLKVWEFVSARLGSLFKKTY
jgi:hypothetical protein